MGKLLSSTITQIRTILFNSNNKCGLGGSANSYLSIFNTKKLSDFAGSIQTQTETEPYSVAWSNTSNVYSDEVSSGTVTASYFLIGSPPDSETEASTVYFYAQLIPSITVSTEEMIKIAPFNQANNRGIKITITIGTNSQE